MPVTTAAAAAAAFDHALRIVLRHEGGFGLHADDPGGATNFGITHTTLAEWRGTPVTVDDVRRLTKAEAGRIYAARYWQGTGAALVAQYGRPKLALLQFDWAVNGGPPKARRYLQAVLNAVAGVGARPLALDGQHGPATRAALEALDDVDELAACDAYQRFRWAHHRIRAGVSAAADHQLLDRAGLTRWKPTPNPDVRRWLEVWGNRLRANAIACGLSPFPSRPFVP